MSAFRRLGQSELLPRYIFVESLLARRRVLEVGAVASTAGESARFLLERGAWDVVACDDDLQAVKEAQHRLGQEHLRYCPAVFEHLEPESFDVVLVADLAPYVRGPVLLAELARRVARNGWLVGALRNPAGIALSQVMDPEQGDVPPTYGQLLDALSAHLPCVEVATQSPLVGYQLAFDSAEGLQVDGSLAGQGEAAWFVVFAGAEPVRPFEPTWVQLPAEPLAFARGKLEEAAERIRVSEDRGYKLKAALEKACAELERLQALEVELATAREHWREEENSEAERLAAHHALESQAQIIRDAQAELAVAQASEAALREALDAQMEAAGELKQQVAQRDARLEFLQRRLNAQESELAALRRTVGRSAATPQVQQIYERATAELEAVKAEIFKRSAGGLKPFSSPGFSSAISSRAPGARLASVPLPTRIPPESLSSSGAPESALGARPPAAVPSPLPLATARPRRGSHRVPDREEISDASDEEDAIPVTVDEDELPNRR